MSDPQADDAAQKTEKALTDFRGTPLRVGDRVIPIAWGDGVTLTLSNTPATVVGVARKRVRIRFDGWGYGIGGGEEYHAVNPRSLRVTSTAEETANPNCAWCEKHGPGQLCVHSLTTSPGQTGGDCG